MGVLTPLDVAIFVASLVAVMALGIWAGRKEDTSQDYYLAGKTTRWWGVAGSIFGSNVSANHIVGMMGVGYSVGFAQSHFEITAIAGLLLLCYAFLPVYRKLGVFTLSQYLGDRYGESSRLAYALIMIAIMVVIQMVPGFYIGSRSLNILLQGGPGQIDPAMFRWGVLLMAAVTGTYTIVGGLKAVIVTDVVQSILLLLAGIVVALFAFAQPEIGGWGGLAALDEAGRQKLHLYRPSSDGELPWTGVLSGLMILHFYYWGTNQFIVQRALSARDDRQARLGIVAAGFFKLLIPFFSIGTGIAAYYLFEKRQLDVAQDAVFTTLLTHLVAPVGFGLVGIVAAGMIGAILSSIDSMLNSAATIITFDVYQRYVDPDASEKQLVAVGRLCVTFFVAGCTVLTLFTMDPNSEESFFLYIADHQGRLIAGLVVAFFLGMLWRRATAAGATAAIVAGVIFSYGLPPLYTAYMGTAPVDKIEGTRVVSPEGADYEPGRAVRFYQQDGDVPQPTGDASAEAVYYAAPRANRSLTLHRTEADALAKRDAIDFGQFERKKLYLYDAQHVALANVLNVVPNFLHTVFVAAVLSLLVHVGVSLLTQPDDEKSRLTWVGLGVFSHSAVAKAALGVAISLVCYAVLGVLMVTEVFPPIACAVLAAGWTLLAFLAAALGAIAHDPDRSLTPGVVLREDRCWGGLLAAAAIFMMYYFY